MNLDREDRRNSFKEFVLKEPKKTREIAKALHNNMFSKTGRTGLQALYELAAGFHDNVEGYVFELGTFRGGSSIVMADAVRSYKKVYPVISIDSGKSNRSNVVMAQELRAKHELEDYLCYVIFDDLSYLELLNTLTPRLIYIDSAHHYEHVKRTLEICSSCLPVGGWLVLDDYIDKSWSRVIPAVNEFLDALDVTNPCFIAYHLENTRLVFLKREV